MANISLTSRVLPREPWRPFDAATTNAVLQAAEAFKRGGGADVANVGSVNSAVVLLENNTMHDLEEMECISWEAPIFTPTESPNEFRKRSLAGAIPLLWKRIAIAAESIRQSGIGRVYIAGVVPAIVNITHVWHGFADFVNNQYVLQSMPHGRCEILYSETATGNNIKCLVMPGPKRESTLLGKPDGNIAAAGMGTVSIYKLGADTTYNVSNVELTWMHNSQQVSVNKEIMIKWFPYEEKWRIIGADCET